MINADKRRGSLGQSWWGRTGVRSGDDGDGLGSSMARERKRGKEQANCPGWGWRRFCIIKAKQGPEKHGWGWWPRAEQPKQGAQFKSGPGHVRSPSQVTRSHPSLPESIRFGSQAGSAGTKTMGELHTKGILARLASLAGVLVGCGAPRRWRMRRAS
jgi:hypothetical protein